MEKEVGTSRKCLIQKLVSGGQTGADRAGLEAAFALGIQTGGWAPKDFVTSEGKDPILGSKFHLKELPSNPSAKIAQQYVARTKKNVDDSDATLVFRLIAVGRGTDMTIGYAMRKKWGGGAVDLTQFDFTECWREPKGTCYKPCLVLTSLDDSKSEENASRIKAFIALHKVQVLNVAGHREEVVDGFSQKIRALLMLALEG